MDEAEVDQQLGIGGDRRRGEDALHQRIPIADLLLRRAIVALLGIGRRGEHQRRLRPVHQPRHHGRVGGIAADQPVIAQRPDVARLGDRLGRGLGDGIGRVIVDRRAVVGVVQQRVQFILGDPDQPEVEVLGHQPAQFLEQQRLVPAAQFGQLVVGDPVGPALRLGQMAQHDDRRLGQPELGGGQDAAMARDQLAVGRDEAGDGPAELGHAGGDLRHLVGVVGLGIAGIGRSRASGQNSIWPGSRGAFMPRAAWPSGRRRSRRFPPARPPGR
jgi:hypothetical protein